MDARTKILMYLWKKPVIVVLILAALAGLVTGPKIYKMFQIRGTVPGALVEKQIVSAKNQEYGRGEDYWKITTTQGESERISFEKWSSLKVGDEIEMVRIPGDEVVYAKYGIYSDDGNLIFDYVLLASEIGGIFFFLVRFFKLRNRPKTALEISETR
jgi:hypothetical protein